MSLPPPKIHGLDAVILITEQFEAMCRFYGHTLGLTETWRGSDGAFFQAGEQTIGVFAKGHHTEGDDRLKGADHGLSHLELRIASTDRETFSKRLHAAGAHAYKDNYQDPDGNLFHFNLDKPNK